MKKFLKIGLNILAITVILSLFFVETEVSTAKALNNNYAMAFRTINNEAFGFGERLNYEVNYSFVTAGQGYFHIWPKEQVVNGRQCYDVRFAVRSLKSLEFLYKVKDSYRTVLDVDGIFPWAFEQHIREGDYKKDFKATFDQENHYAYVKNKKFKIPEYCHDIVSAFYYVRTKDLGSMKKGSVFKLKNFFNKKTYDLGVKIHGKQTIEVEAGTFKCVVIEPMVVEGGLFKNEGKILIWMSDDDLKIPVKVSTKIVIGSVSAELTSYSGLKGKLTSKIK